jgi:hypothetical protein
LAFVFSISNYRFLHLYYLGCRKARFQLSQLKGLSYSPPLRITHSGENSAHDKPMKTPKMFVLLLLIGGCAVQAQDVKKAIQQAVDAELAADRSDRSRWIFFEVDRKPKNDVAQWVAQTAKGDVTRVVSRNGQPISISQQRRNVESFIHDANAQAKQRKAAQRDDKQATDLLKLLPVAFVWTESGKNEQTTTFHFKPDPKFRPPSRETRVFSAMEGDMTVDNRQHRIQELKGRLIRDVNFGYGLLGKLERGGSFDVERRQTGAGVWQITASHIHIRGHALLFKTISEQEDDVKTSFVREPDNVTPEEAASAIMRKQNSG